MNDHQFEIDIVRVIKLLIVRWRTILLSACIGVVMSIMVLIISPVIYRSSCVFVPDNLSFNTISSGLLSQFIIPNIYSNNQNSIPPQVYPQVLNSPSFIKKLLDSNIEISDSTQTILGYIKGTRYYKRASKRIKNSDIISRDTINSYSLEQYICSEFLKKRITLEVFSKKPYLILYYEDTDPIVTATILNKIYIVFQEMIIEYKNDIDREEFYFISKMCNEAKQIMNENKRHLATLLDKNRNLVSNVAGVEIQNMRIQCQLSEEIYLQYFNLLKRIELSLNDKTPILTQISEPTIPIKKYKPDDMRTIFLGIMGSLFIGIFLILIKDNVSNKLEKNSQEHDISLS